jgi:hypothetical protein
MALIVGGTTVTGTQTLDATKLTGNLPAINGASLTALNGTQITSGTFPNARYGTPTFSAANLTSVPTGSSIPVTSYQAVGSYMFMRKNTSMTFTPGATVSGPSLFASGITSDAANTYLLSGTYRAFAYETTSSKGTLGQRIS